MTTVLIWGMLIVYVVGRRSIEGRARSGPTVVVAAEALAFAVTLLFDIPFTGQGTLGLISSCLRWLPAAC